LLLFIECKTPGFKWHYLKHAKWPTADQITHWLTVWYQVDGADILAALEPDEGKDADCEELRRMIELGRGSQPPGPMPRHALVISYGAVPRSTPVIARSAHADRVVQFERGGVSSVDRVTRWKECQSHYRWARERT